MLHLTIFSVIKDIESQEQPTIETGPTKSPHILHQGEMQGIISLVRVLTGSAT